MKSSEVHIGGIYELTNGNHTVKVEAIPARRVGSIIMYQVVGFEPLAHLQCRHLISAKGLSPVKG